MKDVPLKEIMVKKVITAHLEDRLSLMEEKFRRYGIRHIPVVDDANRVVGIFTQRDLAKCVRPYRTEEGEAFDPDQLDQFILKRVMTRDPAVLHPEDTLMHVVDIMARDKFGCIPIVDAHGVLAGIVTQIDVLKYLARALRERKEIF